MINLTRLWFGSPFPGPNRQSGFIAALILLLLFLLGFFSPAQAESFLRVSKKGVIYYFFSNRPGKTPSVTRASRRAQILSPPVQARLSPDKLEPLIDEASRQQNLPSSLVKAVIRVESNFNSNATSPKGAQGLMQLMPGTAGDLQVVDAYDARENVWAGTRYLKMLLEKFHYRLPLALAAYNAGAKRVGQHQDVPPIQETRDFVRNVCANFLKYNRKPVSETKVVVSRP